MKSFQILYIFCSLLLACTSKQTKENDQNKLQSIKLKLEKSEYVNHDLQMLYNELEPYIKEIVWVDEPPGKLSGVNFIFDKDALLNVDLKVIPDSIQFSLKRDWTIDEVTKSKVESIILIKGDSTITTYRK